MDLQLAHAAANYGMNGLFINMTVAVPAAWSCC
jgi:hypothetical protein